VLQPTNPKGRGYNGPEFSLGFFPSWKPSRLGRHRVARSETNLYTYPAGSDWRSEAPCYPGHVTYRHLPCHRCPKMAPGATRDRFSGGSQGFQLNSCGIKTTPLLTPLSCRFTVDPLESASLQLKQLTSYIYIYTHVCVCNREIHLQFVTLVHHPLYFN